MHNLQWLEQWFLDQTCGQPNGRWEYAHGIRIETLDKPGWSVRIDLNDTPYAGLPNAELKRLFHSERDWMLCRVVGGCFEATGGPLMLGPILQTFRSWIESVGTERI